MKHHLPCLFLSFLYLTPLSLSAENWSQFRGPNGSGIIESAKPPLEFGPDKNLSWKSAAPAGVSSPIVWENHIFITGVVDEQLVTVAYDASKGKELWRQAVTPEKLENTHEFSSPASSTPCTDSERVYAYFNSFGVIAYDFDGNEVWQRPLEIHKVQYGSGSSPVLIKGNLIIQREGGAADSHLLALDPKTGETVWTISRPLSQGSHSTPMLWRHDGIEELMVHGRGSIAAYDLLTRDIKWWVDGWGWAAIPIAVVGDGMLFIGSTGTGDPTSPLPKEMDWTYLTSNFDKDKDGSLALAEIPDNARWHIRPAVPIDTPGNNMKISSLLKYGDADKNAIVTEEEWADSMESDLSLKNRDRFVAIRPGGQGNATDTHVVWETSKGLNEMPSPLYCRGKVYVIADGGRLSVFHAKTGERILDRKRVGADGQYVGSPIAANGYIYLTSERGTITIIRPGDQLDVVANNELGENIRSTPAIAGNALIVRTKDHLWKLAE
jgi:outer membrane protein assembly factor BamB